MCICGGKEEKRSIEEATYLKCPKCGLVKIETATCPRVVAQAYQRNVLILRNRSAN